MPKQHKNNNSLRLIKPTAKRQVPLCDAFRGTNSCKPLFTSTGLRLLRDTIQPTETRRMIAFPNGGAARFSAVALNEATQQYQFVRLDRYAPVTVLG